MDSIWLYPLILDAGALQAWGPPMNGVQHVGTPAQFLARWAER
jgi:bacterial/archaeal transporter family-2 protein